MQSLDALPAAVCRALMGVAFDIDDTVTRSGRLELAAFRAMHELVDAGLHLVAVTGRPLGWVDVIARHWPVAVAVGENGAGWVWRDGPAVREGYFDDPARRRDYDDLFARIQERVRRELPHVRLAGDQRARRCDLAFDVGETVRLPPHDVTALVRAIEAEGARSSVSSVHAHAIPGEWNKAVGITGAVRDALALTIADARDGWLFIGDSGNDAEAFHFFPVSVGVHNVREALHRLPTPPRYVTQADRGRGFAEMASHVLRAAERGRR
jgi:hypothetical protein